MRFLLSDLQPGTAYVVRARSKNGSDFSNWSRDFSVSTNGDTVAPKTPTNPVASMNGTSFTLKWDAVTQSADNSAASDLDHYDVEVSSLGSANVVVYVTKDTKFEFSFEQNVNAFAGVPQANVRMRVRAVDAVGNASPYTALASQTNAAPSAPTSFSGSAGQNSLSFSWNAVSDLDLKQYRIYSGTAAGSQTTLMWTGTALNATIQLADTSTDRWYKVVAVDVFNSESAASNVVGPLKPTSPTTVDTVAPAVPTGLAGTLTNATDGKTASMAVTWTAVGDADLDSYIVAFRQQASPVNDWQYVTVDKATTSTTIQGLVPYKAHDIRIRAKDFSANYSAWSTIVAVTAQANTAPATPTGLAATAGKDNLQISWNENSEPDVANNAGLYEVTVATNAGFTTGVLNYKTAATTLSINGLTTNTQYFVRVRAIDSAGLTSAAWSTSTNATTSNFSGGSDGAVPVGAVTLSASAGIGYIYLSWTPLANNDPVVYDVYMSTTSGFTTYDATTKITEVSGTQAFIDTTVAGATLAYGTTYYFKVRARDKDGSSATVSNQASAAPVQAGNADLTTAVNTSITDAQTAANNAQTTADASDAINVNPNFSKWPSANPAPDGWQVWNTGPTRETSIVRTSPYAVRFNCTDATTQRGLTQTSGNIPMPLGTEYVTLTYEVMLNSGTSFGGAGFLFDWTGMTGAYRATLPISADIPNPSTGRWYRVTKVVRRGATATGTQTNWGIFLMGQYASIGSTQAIKDVIFNRVAVRPSTNEEISAYNAAPVSMVNDLDARVASKGTDLVTNGSGLLGSNYNFSALDYSATDAPTGANGSFVIKNTNAQGQMIDEYIPFDPLKKYKFSFQARQTVAGATNRMYGFVSPFDAANASIAPQHYMYIAGTTTTLAADLKPGDTTIQLTSSANWYGQAGKNAGTSTHLRGVVIWNYVDPAGKAWAPETYSRNSYLNLWADGGIVGNTITLNNPWPTANGTIPAGTSLSNSTSGGSYMYMPSVQNTLVPETWTAYSDTFSAGIMSPAQQASPTSGAATWTTGMPPGTAKIKVGWLFNYAASPTNTIAGKHAVAAVSLSDASAAQSTADAAATAAANSSQVYIQSTAPVGRSQDLWIDTTGGANTPKRWNGSAWVTATDQAAIAAAQNYTDTKFQASLKNTVVEYSVNSSETVAPTTGWSSATPTRTPGTFVWYRTVLTFGDNSTSTSNPALLTGNTGATGTAGANAEVINLTASAQILSSPAGGGATSPTTAVVTGNPINTTIGYWEYSVDGAAFSTTPPSWAVRSGNVVTVTGSTMTAKTIAIRMSKASGSPIADTLTVAKVFDGATGATGTAGTNGTNGAAGADAYTVVLTNEAQVFAGSTNAANAGSATTQVIAYKGATQMPATIGTITGAVTGLTPAITNNGSNNAGVTITVTTALTTQSGTLTIPITVDGKSFTKTFAWSVSYTGAQGSAGPAGTNGVSVSSITPYFYQVTPANGTAPTVTTPTASTPGAGWTTTEPTYVKDSALYRTERIAYSSGTYAYTAVYRSSAYDAAAAAQTTADGKNKIMRSTADATGSQFVDGDLWWKLDANGNVIKQWKFVLGTGWTVETLMDGVLGSLNANKIVAGTTFTQDLYVKSNFTLGDATTPGIIKSYDYVANSAGFSLSSAGLQINNGDIDAKTLRANTSFVNTLFVGAGGAVQSTGFNASTGFQLSSSGLIIRGAGNSVDVGALNAGTITGKQFIIGAGGSFVADSTGYFKSNTYAGTTYAAGGTTGWYLGNDGLRINEGAINAKALISSTIDTATITLSGANGKIVGTGFTLAGNGLTVTSGSISAPALQIQSGASNLMRPEYSAFEFTPSFYSARFLGVNSTQSIQTSGGIQGSQFLRMTTTATGQTSLILGDTGTDYNISVEASKTYIISAWMKASTATAVSAYLRFKYSDGTYSTQTPVTLPASGAWVRYAFPATIPAGVTSAVVQVFNSTTTSGVGVDLDGVMVEQKIGALNTPSTYVMPGMTSADGGFLRTGEIRSTANVTVNGVSQPAWSINMAGGAQFGDAVVRGKVVVGPTTSTNVAPNGGTFESNITGYTVYAVGGTGAALSRTTTAGELITGTGSMKIGWTAIPTKYGFSFSLINGAVSPAGIPAGNVIKVTMNVRGLTTSSIAGSDLVAEFLDSGNNVVYTSGNILPAPTYLQPNTVMSVNYNIVLPSGIANATTVRIYSNKSSVTPAATGVVYDDVVFSVGDDVGSSYISSGNFAQGDMGWKIGSGGTAEFNNVTIRGGLQTASSGPRWQIGTTPQWYGASSDIISYSGSPIEEIPAKITSYGGGISMSGAKATNVGSYPTFSLTNNNFLSTDPNVYMGTANLQASSIYISGQAGLASDGNRYGSMVSITAYDDTLGTVRGDSSLTLKSGGADITSGIELSSNGNIIHTVQKTANGPANPRVYLSFGDPLNSIFQNSMVTVDETFTRIDGPYDSNTTGNSYILAGQATLQFAINGGSYGKSSSISMAGSDGSININAGGPLNITAANGLSGIAGNVSEQMMFINRAMAPGGTTGGGLLNVDTSYNISWSQRFMIIANGKGTNLTTGGYFAIAMPAVGTVIPGYGGAPASTTVTSAGIALASWGTLYYEIPFGDVGSTSYDSNFRMVGYTGNFTVPANWIPVASRNNDQTMVYFLNGCGFTPWFTPALTGGWSNYGSGYDTFAYRKDNAGLVYLRGLIKSGSTGFANAAFTLPAGYRPNATLLVPTSASGGIADVRVFSGGEVTVYGFFAGGNNGSVSTTLPPFYAAS